MKILRLITIKTNIAIWREKSTFCNWQFFSWNFLGYFKINNAIWRKNITFRIFKVIFNSFSFIDCCYGIVMIVATRITLKLATTETATGTKSGTVQIPPVNPGKLSIFLDVQSFSFGSLERTIQKTKYFIAFISNVRHWQKLKIRITN